MAGFYPDAPAARIPFDRDGTTGVIFASDGSGITTLTTTQLQQLNNENNDGFNLGSDAYVALIFPTLRDISHVFRSLEAGASLDVTKSNDTTNGFDGTWVTISTTGTSSATVPNWRTTFTAVSATGIKAIRVRSTSSTTRVLRAFFLYGTISATSSRLELWHPTLDQPLSTTPAYFDYGDVARGSAAIEKDFRVKNLSSSLTANTITVGCEALTDGTPTFVSQTSFRYNGGSYASTATLSSLPATGISQVFTVRFTPSATAPLSIYAQRYYATASSWS